MALNPLHGERRKGKKYQNSFYFNIHTKHDDVKSNAAKNPEMNEHQRGFVPQDETQSDSEVRSQTTRNQKEEEGVSRLIDQMIERVRKENEESEEENEN